jgi:hypothetical protein
VPRRWTVHLMREGREARGEEEGKRAEAATREMHLAANCLSRCGYGARRPDPTRTPQAGFETGSRA